MKVNQIKNKQLHGESLDSKNGSNGKIYSKPLKANF